MLKRWTRKASLGFAFLLSNPFTPFPFILETFLECHIDERGSVWYERVIPAGILNLNWGGPKRKTNSKKLTFWPIISKWEALQWRAPRHPLCCTYDVMYNLWRPLSKKQSHLIYLFLHLHIVEMSGQGWPDSNAIIVIMGTVCPPLRQKKTKREGSRSLYNWKRHNPLSTLATACACHPHQKRKNWTDYFMLYQWFLIAARWAISEQIQTSQERWLLPRLFISQVFVTPRHGISNYSVSGLLIRGFQSINNMGTLTLQDNKDQKS